jgi:hypothetical protein
MTYLRNGTTCTPRAADRAACVSRRLGGEFWTGTTWSDEARDAAVFDSDHLPARVDGLDLKVICSQLIYSDPAGCAPMAAPEACE